MLGSGLPERISDDEELARFLTSSNHFSAGIVKAPAFLPSPRQRETSVFRHGAEPRDRLWEIGDVLVAGERRLHGAAVVRTRAVRDTGLDATAAEPPPLHAAITGWPWIEHDPQLQRAQRKRLAALIAGAAILIPRPPSPA
jgi:hypothetical protein